MIDRPAEELDDQRRRPPWPRDGLVVPAQDGKVEPTGADAGGRQGRHHRHAAQQKRSGALSMLRETVIILVSALVLSLVVKTFLIQAFFIPSPSMEQTLVEDDRILVSKLTPGPFDLKRGDIVVFKDPGDWLSGAQEVAPTGFDKVVRTVLTFVGLYPQDAGEHLVKRIIGLPGDHVACDETCRSQGGPITVNGVAVDEPYLAPGAVPSDVAFDVVVPADSLWVMGDNRQHSFDSRFNMGKPGGGSVPVANVVGVAFVTVWPLDRAGLLRNPTAAFEDVPAAP
ncbi:signal peptidase I [Cellulomonas fimi]|uniref:Signal peptidase I n=1 Tax=Cellulomonas fimi (strain ATCC 484 / DSM 20113 / JCM 1341 / CCUG 24087 / LMG 16345 / NBRC 15513 / NCIMB 8980 / NCTC 7547 / NRS-133) TaxID=590998 RepID=F4H6K8_CELFA|nr:signal peptidase I [Cellulomonas fimi]AEE45641.1 signal peptidase I [Cellulomonas fimi ATCC 484]VEH30153.1 Signal peptidase I P [Cellulomonas fimi]